MEKRELNRKFRKYVLSSMITMFLESAYSLVDGVFVSNFVGGSALAAINVAWPIIAVVTALGTGCGCGGAVLMSIHQGAGDQEQSNEVRADTILLLLVTGVLSTVLFQIFLKQALILMGCSGSLLNLAVLYGRFMIGGSIVQILSCGLAPLLRNDNKAVSAMAIMVSGFGLHILLDYVLLHFFGLGVAGAAISSVTAQAFTTICCFIILLTKKDNPLRPVQFRLIPRKSGSETQQTGTEKVIRWERWRQIIRTGISPFGISLTPSFLILWHNMACLSTGNEGIVTAYALITSTVGSYRMLLIGVAEGMQPLASYAYGEKNSKDMFRIRNMSITLAYIVSIALFLLTMGTAQFYPALYGYTDSSLEEVCVHAIRWTAPQLIFTGMVRVSNSYFYAVGKNLYSLLMIYLDPLVLTPLMLTILMHLIGTDGIWLNADVTQLMLNVLAVWMFVRHEREVKNYENYGTAGKNCPAGSAC
jgi:Na+-driven multidrug efflux pump